jgi:hypothetical protein
MQPTIVESAAFTGIAYDAATQRLEVEFRNRTIYQYFGVSVEIYAAFLRSASKGSFFNSAIRSRFPSVLVSTPSVRRLS